MPTHIIRSIIDYLRIKKPDLNNNPAQETETVSKKQADLSKEVDDIISIVSHEFRTPVSIIKGYLEILLANKERNITLEQMDFLKKINNNLARLNAIIENSLNVSVLESGTMSIFLQPVDFEKLVTETVENTLKPLAADKKLSLILNLPETRLPLISADPQRLRQIIINVVDNAIKYTDIGTITITVRKDDHHVIFTVTDIGRGISPEDLPNLYKKFFRGGDYMTRTIQGSGLGLYVTKELLEKQNGTIDITSVVNKGTTVTIKLPLPREDETWSQNY